MANFSFEEATSPKATFSFEDAVTPKTQKVDSLANAKKGKPGLLEEATGGIIEPIMRIGSSIIAKPVSDIAGLAATAHDAITGQQGDPIGFKKHVQEALTYEPRTQLGGSDYNPLNAIPNAIGSGVNAVTSGAGDLVRGNGNSPIRNALGDATKEAGDQAVGFIAPKVVPKITEAASKLTKGRAEWLMNNALKPTVEQTQKGDAAVAVKTLLDEGVNVSKGGAEKLRELINADNQQIADKIANSKATIDKAKVVNGLQDVRSTFTNQVDPHTDLAAILKVEQGFDNHPTLTSNQIPVQEAQKLKQGTYSVLNKKYGQMGSAETEAQKGLARGLKDEIANAVPDIAGLNAHESALIKTLSLTERRALLEANKNPLGLSPLTHNPVAMAAYLADKSSAFKSIFARVLNQSSKQNPLSALLKSPINYLPRDNEKKVDLRELALKDN